MKGIFFSKAKAQRVRVGAWRAEKMSAATLFPSQKSQKITDEPLVGDFSTPILYIVEVKMDAL